MRQFSLSFSSIETKNHKIDTEKHDNIDNKRQQSFYSFLKKLSSVVVNKKKVYQQSERQYDTPLVNLH